MLRLLAQHLELWFQAPTYFVANPLQWLKYQVNVLILIWGLELWRFVDTHLLPAPKAKVMVMEMEYEEPIVKEIVLIGAGHAHVHVLKAFAMNPERNVRLTLITEGVDTPYSGMLPGFVSGLYTREECHIDVLRLAEFAKARVVIGKAKQVWMDSKTVLVEGARGNAPIHFDVLSINIGSSPTLPRENAHLVIPVKPIVHMVKELDRILKRGEDDTRERLRVAVVGAGAGGVEIAYALYHRLRDANALQELVLITKNDSVCPSHSKQFQKLVEENLRTTTEIKLMLSREALGVERTADGKQIAVKLALSSNGLGDGKQELELFDEVIWCTNARGASWLSEAFNVDQQGFVKVNTKLQVNAHVFAAGDCACFEASPLAKSGVFAVRQGPILATNLRLAAQNAPASALVDFVPQHTFLGLLGTQNGRLAMASKGEMGVAAHPWLWDLKEWIDRKWMSGYKEMLPTRHFPSKLDKKRTGRVAQSLDEDAQDELCRMGMKCGGCGSKVGGSVLSKTLSRLPILQREEVVCGASGDDCSLIQVGPQSLVATSVDFFRSIWRDEYVFAQICVNHALSDVWAMGCEPVSALCMAQVPVSPERIMQHRLQTLMRGAVDQLNENNCSLTGGHTTEGPELTLGFSVLGSSGSGNAPPLLKQGLAGSVRAGDVLILTKAIGTGTIMEAHMRLQAEGQWVMAALDSMLQSNQVASEILRKHGATALTDVTGFGLGGHLSEMLRDHGGEYFAQVELGAVPLLFGAVECMELQDYTSSLAIANERAGLQRMRHKFVEEEDLLLVSLLFDPQTSGGLLAFVPRENAIACLHELQAKQYCDAARIGQLCAKAARADLSSQILVELV